MRRFRKIFIPLMAASIVLIRSPVMPVTVYADTQSAEEAASEALNISSTLTYTARADGKAIDGADITLYKVADVFTDNQGHRSYVPTDLYTSVLNGKSDDDIKQHARVYAEQMAQIASDAYKTVTTDASGQAVFTGVPEGCYLVKETKKSGTAAEFGDFEPSIILLPETDDSGAVNDNVQAQVKVPPVRTTTVTQPPVPTQKQTSGHSTNVTRTSFGRSAGGESPSETVRTTSPSSRIAQALKSVRTGDETRGMVLGAVIAFSSFLLLLTAGRKKKQ